MNQISGSIASFAHPMAGPFALACGGALYIALLFLVAFAADRRASPGRFAPRGSLRAGFVYAMTLAVYNTAWSFYGSVGKAARDGLEFLPIYLAPTLLLLLARPVLGRIADIVRTQNITSIADFMGARYGKSQSVAAFVTLASLFGMLPYIALQLKAVATSFDLAAGGGIHHGGSFLGDTAFWVAGAVAIFTVVFGVRHIHAREHHLGLMLAVAFESFVKITIFLAVGLFILFWVVSDPSRVMTAATAAQAPGVEAVHANAAAWIADTLVAAFAFLCLPHTFHAAFVELEDKRDISRAALIFPLYLAIFSSLMLPVAQAGLALLPHGTDPDTYMIRLPMLGHAPLVSFATFIGGMSAATGMTILSAVSLSTMICNDVVLPIWLRRRGFDALDGIRPFLLSVRRLAVVLVLLLAYLTHRFLDGHAALATIGFVSFVGVAQLGPAFVGGLFWRGGSRTGVLAGMATGLGIWVLMLVMPSDAALFAGRIGLVWPSALGPAAIDPVSRAAFLSLAANLGVFLLVSRLSGPGPSERMQARLFTGDLAIETGQTSRSHIVTTFGDLRDLAGQFAGPGQGVQALDRYLAARSARTGEEATPSSIADLDAVRFTESLVAGAIGAASARLVVATRLQGGRMLSRQTALAMLDEASSALQFNRRLLQATLESVGQGICVLDEAGRLSVWNSRFVELSDLGGERLRIGASLPRVPGLELLHAPVDPTRRRRRMERILGSGLVIEINVERLPAGGRIATLVDVTEQHQAAEALRHANETLEERVRSRTRELEAATVAAQRANASKSRFLASAGHDLVQPLSAARLFISALDARLSASLLENEMKGDLQTYTTRAARALNVAESLLDGLLDISALDSGALTPDIEDCDLGSLLSQLADEFRPLAERKGLDLRFVRAGLRARTDSRLLRRVIQNLLANAIRYTSRGRVLIGMRRRSGWIRIEVRDTGPGIAPEEQAEIFQEFRRLAPALRADEKGLGLGLAIVERISKLLGLKHGVVSQPGHGSMFFVEVPRAHGAPASAAAEDATPAARDEGSLRILCIDDDPIVRDSLSAVLREWGHQVTCAGDAEHALAEAAEPADLVIVDYDLGGDMNGIELIELLRRKLRYEAPTLLLTASRLESLRAAAREAGFALLHKPVKPAALRRFVTAVRLAGHTAQSHPEQPTV